MWPFEKPRHNTRDLVDAGAVLLDVRTAEEFADRHIQGAINIPVHELSGRLKEVGTTMRPVVVYCRSGARSASAARQLRRAGYEVNDIGGINNW